MSLWLLIKKIWSGIFQEDLKPSIQAQLDAQRQKFDFFDKIVEKTINLKAKALLQLPYSIRKINAKPKL